MGIVEFMNKFKACEWIRSSFVVSSCRVLMENEASCDKKGLTDNFMVENCLKLSFGTLSLFLNYVISEIILFGKLGRLYIILTSHSIDLKTRKELFS